MRYTEEEEEEGGRGNGNRICYSGHQGIVTNRYKFASCPPIHLDGERRRDHQLMEIGTQVLTTSSSSGDTFNHN